ncbi:MAG: CBS domain-containing protein [Gammaproteobacteria bacterium]|nr:CBS domain-containing protein [Gammaproteobacteria bacterium]
MSSIKQTLEQKGYDVWSIDVDQVVLDAIRLMAEKGIGALVVTEHEKMIGVITERDYARKIALKGRASSNTNIRDIMSDTVFYASPDNTVEECMAMMTEKRIRHLPIMEGDKLIGLISIGDLVKAKIAEQKFLIDQLLHYIHS